MARITQWPPPPGVEVRYVEPGEEPGPDKQAPSLDQFAAAQASEAGICAWAGALLSAPEVTLGNIREIGPAIKRRKDELHLARMSEPAPEVTPDNPDALFWCSFCGQSDIARIAPLTEGGRDYNCRDEDLCLSRHQERFPDGQEVRLAAASLESARRASRSAAVALSVVEAAMGLAEMTAAQARAPAPPLPLPGGRWSHTLRSPLNRAHYAKPGLISGMKQDRGR